MATTRRELFQAAIGLTMTATARPDDSETWQFDRLDRIGAHATMLLGHPRVVDSAGAKAIVFDGVHDAIMLDVHPLAAATTFTWEAIFRPDGGEPAQRWFHLQENGTENRMLFEIRIIDGRWCLDSYLHSSLGNRALMNRDRLHPLGVWHHVAAVYDGQEFRNYVDSVQEGAALVPFQPQKDGRTAIGVRMNLVNYFMGAIRLARFTRRALAPSEFLTTASR